MLVLVVFADIAAGFALFIIPPLARAIAAGPAAGGVAAEVTSVASIALAALGVACWSGPSIGGMLIYSVGFTAYLAFVAA